MRLAPSVAAVLVALTVLAAPSRGADGCRIERGGHFRLICHFDDERCAKAALETVEAIWPAASNLYSLPEGPLDPPIDVHLYRNTADYLVDERALTGGVFDRNLAFTSHETRAAYVAVQPDLGAEALAAIGLTEQTRRLLAHEAAHAVRFRKYPSYRLHPGWFGDGAAQWIEDETMRAHGWCAPLEEDPHVAYEMTLAKKLLAGGHMPPARAVLNDRTDGLEFYTRYAVRRLLFRRLITRNDAGAFRAACTKALALPSGDDFAARFFAAVTSAYAAEGLDGLDLDFEQFVRSQTPAWDEEWRSLSTAGEAWAQTAFPERNAVAWRTAPVAADSYELRGELEILPGIGKTNQANVLLSRGADGWISVAFVAGYGVDVIARRIDGDRWDKIAEGPTPAVQLWRRIPIRVVVDGAKVSVRVDGNEVASAQVADHDMKGPWGLGVQAGAAALWHGVKVEPVKRR